MPLTSARQVTGPTMPSTATDGMSRWRACWKPWTAASELGPEDAVHGDIVAPGSEQVLQRLDRMLLVTFADERPWADRAGGHRLPSFHAGHGGRASVGWICRFCPVQIMIS